jgi:ketosteroid isomerase-like protein
MSGNLEDAQRDAQLDALASCYAEHTDVRHPLAPFGDNPLRTRDGLRAHFAAARLADVHRWEVVDPTVHRTRDPELVIFEFAYAITVGGNDFRIPNIFVVRVRDGVIVESRDYADHLSAARAFGRLNQLIERTTSATGVTPDAVTSATQPAPNRTPGTARLGSRRTR